MSEEIRTFNKLTQFNFNLLLVRLLHLGHDHCLKRPSLASMKTRPVISQDILVNVKKVQTG